MANHPTGTTHPSIHLNGSSPETMLQDVIEALEPLRRAQEAITHTAPHMRDYPLRGEDYTLARQKHAQRWQAIQGVIDQLSELGEYLANNQR